MSVCIAYLHPGEVSHSFHNSLIELMLHDLGNEAHVVGRIVEESGPRIADARNSAVRQFLRTDATYLLFIDADMGFDADALDRLLAVADPQERPIVGGLCFAQQRGPRTSAGARHMETVPTVYQWIENGQAVGCVPVTDYPRDALVECDATGAAFFLAHRSVYEKMAEACPPPREWFAETIINGQVFGEDVSFFRRAALLGFPIYVHTGVKTSHYKPSYLDEASYVSPDAKTYVVVPMKNRMDLTEQLLDELAAQDEYEAVFVCDNGSKREVRNRLAALRHPRVEVFDCAGMNIHQMWNAGINEATRRSWPCNVAILNNDIKVGPRFLSGLADELRSDPLLGVVSPNYDGRVGEGVEYVEEICAGRYDGTGGLAGFAFMVKGESGYRFPEELQWWCGDNDMLMSVLASGCKAAIVRDVSCEHVNGGGQTGNWRDPEMRKVLARDRAWFEAKWVKQTA